MMNSSHFDFFELTKYTSNPITAPESTERFLAAVNNTLVYWDGTAWTVVGSGGGGGSTWETLYANDNTFNIVSGNGFSIADTAASANATLTLTKDSGSSGHALQITQAGSGKDINGTSNTWSVTKAGVATFAGISISGTSTAMVTTDDATWEIKDNDATALRIGPSGGPVFLTFDTRNSAEVLSTDALTFQVTAGKTNLIQASNTISALVVTDNTVTTFGADANSAGVAVLRSTSLTTGSLLQLQLAEGTLNGGFYLTARDSTGSANVFTIGEDGATVIAGAGGNTVFTITAGDAVMSDGSLAITDADNAATFTVTNNTATSASVVVVAGSGVHTGTTTTSFMTITPSGLTTGTALYIAAAAATTSVAVVDLAVAGLTSGSALRITAATANFTTGGKLIELTSTAATAGNLLTATTTGAYTGTGMILVTAGAATTGVLVSLISTTGLTSGSLLRATSSTAGAIATNGAISFRATGAFTSTSNVGYVDVLASATTAGTVMRIASTAASQTATELLRIDASGFTTGYTGSVVTMTSSSTTGAGNILQVTSVATSAGDAVKLINNALVAGTSTILNVSHTTSVLGAGNSLVRISSTGVDTGTTTGVLLDLSTTGADGCTNVMLTDSSADVSLRSGIMSKITNTAAVAARTFVSSNVAVNNSKFTRHFTSTDGTKTVTIWISQDGTSPHTVLTGQAGDICLNGTSGVPFYCPADGTNWTALA